MDDSLNATPDMSQSYPSRSTLSDFYQAQPMEFSDVVNGIPPDIDMIVWASHSRRLPDEYRDARVLAELKHFLARGGALFLVGFAQKIVVDLGLETVSPDRCDFLRVNHNDASPAGSYFVTGMHFHNSSDLTSGMVEADGDSSTYFVGAAAAMVLETCGWEKKSPGTAKTLAMMRHVYEKGEPSIGDGLRILNEWQETGGKVLGYGNNLFLDECWHNPHRQNLDKFLSNVPVYLTNRSAPIIAALPEVPAVLSADEYMQLPAFPDQQPHTLNRRFPGLPYISHWGWHAAIDYQRDRRTSVDIDYFRERLLNEPFRWGCNLVEFYPPDMDDGFPFVWDEDDPIPRPEDPLYYWGGEFDPMWNTEKAREVFRLAHARDMTVQLFYHPDLVRRRRGTVGGDIERSALDATEFQARELQNPLLYGRESSHDGMGAEWWADGRNGEYTDRVWHYNPGSYQYSTALLPATTPNFAGAWMCAFGRSAGINACGFGELWRYVFHPPLFLSYQADCRSKKASSDEWGGWANYGGGSTPDWLLSQVSYFARDRLYLDSSIWWLGEPKSTMLEEDRQFVYGISSDPLRCAVTSDMRAVGSNGYRARAASTIKNIHPNYSCAEKYPQNTAFIQNNYFRLLRFAGNDRGVLEYDPTRLAHFTRFSRPQPVAEISTGFLRARPVDLNFETGDVDVSRDAILIAFGEVENAMPFSTRAGNYSRKHECNAEDDVFPACIGYEIWPDWPQEVALSFDAEVGTYELDVAYQATPSTSTIEVELDGRIAGYYFSVAKTADHDSISFGVTEPGLHTILLRLQKSADDSSVAEGVVCRRHSFDSVSIRKTGSTGITHTYPLAVGCLARLEETVATNLQENCRQVRTYTVLSDSPALRIDITCEAPRPTVWELAFALPGYGNPVLVQDRIYAMQPEDDDKPILCLFFLDGEIDSISRFEGDVVISTLKAERSMISLGILIDDGLYSAAHYDSVRDSVFCDPETIEIADSTTTYHNHSAAPLVKVVQIPNPTGRPYQVAEENSDGEHYWYTRGAQVHIDSDYLKLYLQPEGTAKIREYGFIDGEVKPGYGCQYMLAIRDSIRNGFCEVEVVKTGPFVFAPRLEWSRQFDTVQVNGEPWRYFDGSVVYLPNKPGRYTVEIAETGLDAPTIGRTFLCVESAQWLEDELALELKTTVPHWWDGPLPGDIAYTAHVLSNRYVAKDIDGHGEIVKWSEYRATPEDLDAMAMRGNVLRLKPGKAKIAFRIR